MYIMYNVYNVYNVNDVLKIIKIDMSPFERLVQRILPPVAFPGHAAGRRLVPCLRPAATSSAQLGTEGVQVLRRWKV